MDQYGSFQNNEKDYDELANDLAKHNTIVFSWSHNQIDGYIFMISIGFVKLGMMPFGGQPTGRAYVGLWGRGCDHIRMDGGLLKYDLDKLNIDDDGAEKFTELWNEVCKRIPKEMGGLK